MDSTRIQSSLYPTSQLTSYSTLEPVLPNYPQSIRLTLTGAFTYDTVHSDLQIGEFHAELELDGGEKVRAIIPEAVCVPSSASVLPSM
jgi:hypothetical protein